MNKIGSKNSKAKILLLSVVLAMILTVIFMLIFSGIMLSAGISGKGIGVIVILLNIIPVFVAGYYAGKKTGEKKYLWGTITALVFFILYLSISFAFRSENTLNLGQSIRTFFIMTFSGMLGGMLS